MALTLDPKSRDKLRSFFSSLNFNDKYKHLMKVAEEFDSKPDMKKDHSSTKAFYEDLVYQYPFNNNLWKKYAMFFIRLQEYHQAFNVNKVYISYNAATSLHPTSLELWKSFINFVTDFFVKKPEQVISVYEAAIKNFQYDVDSTEIWERYLSFLESLDPFKAQILYWRILNFPISDPNRLIQRYAGFLSRFDSSQYRELMTSYKELPLPAEVCANKNFALQFYTQKIREVAHANPTVDLERRLDGILQKTEINGEDLDPNRDMALSQFLAEQRKVLSHDRLVYLYRKCLIAKCKYGDFWLKLLHILDEHESTRDQVNKFFGLYKKHFEIIENKELVFFFFADVREKERDITKCREIYKDLEARKVLEAYPRHLYMEIRTLNTLEAIHVFVSLGQSKLDPTQVAPVLHEMVDLFLEQLGDITKARQVFKQFNEKIPAYSKIINLAWINYLKKSQRPWGEIDDVFKLMFSDSPLGEDKRDLWEFYMKTARTYCSDIDTLREVEKRYLFREEPGRDSSISLNAKRSFQSIDDNRDDKIYLTRKQEKLG